MIRVELLVSCKNAVKNFGREKALKNVSFEIKKGQIVGLLGENGSGKTSLLNCIAGLSHLSSGEVSINGVSVQDYKVKRELAYMPVVNLFNPKWTIKNAVESFSGLFSGF